MSALTVGRGRAAAQRLRQWLVRRRGAREAVGGQDAAQRASLAAKVIGATACAGALAGLGSAAYTLSAVHAARKRGHADEFVLTPEDLNMPYHEVQFFTEDGVSLTGWFIPQTSGGKPSQRVVVCCHPHNSSKSNLLGVARGLWERRYSVFMFDFRSFAHTPTRQSVGFFEQRDARAAVACARRTAPAGSEIGLIGASMGGAVALIVGHEAEVDAVGVATDCAFASISDVLRTRVASIMHVPPAVANAIVQIGELLNPLMYGYRLSEVAPASAVAAEGSERAGEVPLLLMHAEGDEIVTVSQAHAIYSAAAVADEQKKLIVVQHCHHVGCFFADRPGYHLQLGSFFDAAFAAREAKVNDEKQRSAD